VQLPVVELIGVLLFAGASFFFALAESALFSLGKWRIDLLASEFPKSGGSVRNLLKAPQDLLGTLVLGNTFSNAAIIGISLWVALREGWPIAWTIAGLVVFVLVVCEVVPKSLAVRSPEQWSLRLARTVLLVRAVTGPMRGVATRLNTLLLRVLVPRSFHARPTLTDSEYQELVEMGYQQGALEKSEKEIILQVVNLDRSTVGDVMRPRAQMAAIPDDLPVSEMIAAARVLRHRRIALFDETPDTIVGILNTRTLLLNPDIDLSEAIEFPSFVPESMNLLQLFKSLQRQQRGLAIVLDEFGGTAGLVTMEDILEEVVGEIHSEGEAQGFIIEKLGDGKWRVNGTMRLDDFRREYPALGEVPEVDTMAGLLLLKLGVVPVQGQSARFGGLRLKALVVDERRIKELQVEVFRK
jgi:putative hemolysin